MVFGIKRGLAMAAVLALAGCSGAERALQTTSPAANTPLAQSALPAAVPGNGNAYGNSQAVCAGPEAEGYRRCHAHIRTDVTNNTTPSGYGPAQLRAAYSLPSTSAGAGQTVAIVDAYDDPNAENDMNVYRAQFGISPCTTANGCFQKVNQSGAAGNYPRGNASWGQEISLDLDMASAICPLCHIILVEANSNQNGDLAAAVDTAAALGAVAISNSYGSSESATSVSYDSHYNHPGAAITVSSGDNGYGVQSPASSGYVTAVGGTSLNTASNARGWTESAWSGAGAGCSAYNTKPSWQGDAGCAKRTVADVSAVADPNTGVSVYDSYGHHNQTGWLVFGGTSVASPIIASVYALGGNASSVNYGSYPYAHTGSLFDVTTGNDGTCGTYLCTAVAGYDGPTGNGTPNTSAAF